MTGIECSDLFYEKMEDGDHYSSKDYRPGPHHAQCDDTAFTNTRAAGSASALLGVSQGAIGAIVAPLVGLGGATTALPMAAAIAAFGVAALVTFIVFCRPAQTHAKGGRSPLSARESPVSPQSSHNHPLGDIPFSMPE